MTKYIENYNYTECGLEYIVLEKVEIQETNYGQAVHIKNHQELHKTIARLILESNRPIRGREIQFFRKTLKMKQTELSKTLNLSQSTISTWETSEKERPLDLPTQYLLRCFFSEKFKLGPTPASEYLKNVEKMEIEKESSILIAS